MANLRAEVECTSLPFPAILSSLPFFTLSLSLPVLRLPYFFLTPFLPSSPALLFPSPPLPFRESGERRKRSPGRQLSFDNIFSNHSCSLILACKLPDANQSAHATFFAGWEGGQVQLTNRIGAMTGLKDN